MDIAREPAGNILCRQGNLRGKCAAPVLAEPRSRLVIRCLPPVLSAASLSEAQDARIMAGVNRLRAASTIPSIIRIADGAVRSARLRVSIPAGVAQDGQTRAQWFTRVYSNVLSLDAPAGELQMIACSSDDCSLASPRV